MILHSTSKSPVYHSHDRSHSFGQLTHLHTCKPGTQLVMAVQLYLSRIFERFTKLVSQAIDQDKIFDRSNKGLSIMGFTEGLTFRI